MRNHLGGMKMAVEDWCTLNIGDRLASVDCTIGRLQSTSVAFPGLYSSFYRIKAHTP